MKSVILSISYLFIALPLFSQNSDSVTLRKIFNQALLKGEAYSNLEVLCRDYGKRLAGSPGAAGAVEYTKKLMLDLGVDSVWLQPCMVPHWVRGEKEIAYYISSKSEKKPLTICALGNSTGTGVQGITASLIEVRNWRELDSLGRKNIQGKIVFFNHPMDQTKISTFDAYGDAVQYRFSGPDSAASFGAVAVVIRSVSTAHDDFPHTGSLGYRDSTRKIPACALSTMAADELSSQLKQDPGTKFYFRQTCEMLPDVLSYNVIAELRGADHRDEYITVGGHIDAWETGNGAHDDGAGAVQSIEVLRIFKQLNMHPSHTIRAVMFMNEENGTRGAKQYAAQAKLKNEKHLFAIESDAGGFSPIGFGFDAPKEVREKIQSWKPLFTPYSIYDFEHGGDGADVGYLKNTGAVLSGLSPSPNRYFDYHHAASDTFDKVNRRELELGAAAMAALIYLVDKYGL
ncbi:MAG: M20/M25/M40 family metallo-hydrolase [Chitinophagales bacterium]|nr:M20/M25/M40 family metallo-hydrolase [Chitinophagales bacterium]